MTRWHNGEKKAQVIQNSAQFSWPRNNISQADRLILGLQIWLLHLILRNGHKLLKKAPFSTKHYGLTAWQNGLSQTCQFCILFVLVPSEFKVQFKVCVLLFIALGNNSFCIRGHSGCVDLDSWKPQKQTWWKLTKRNRKSLSHTHY